MRQRECDRKLKVKEKPKGEFFLIPDDYDTQCPRCNTSFKIASDNVEKGAVVFCEKDECKRKLIVDKINTNNVNLIEAPFKEKCPECGKELDIPAEKGKENEKLVCTNQKCQRNLIVKLLTVNELKLEPDSFVTDCPKCGEEQIIHYSKGNEGEKVTCNNKDCGRNLIVNRISTNKIDLKTAPFIIDCPYCVKPLTLESKIFKSSKIYKCDNCDRMLNIKRISQNDVVAEETWFTEYCPNPDCLERLTFPPDTKELSCYKCNRYLKVEKTKDPNKVKLVLQELSLKCPNCSNKQSIPLNKEKDGEEIICKNCQKNLELKKISEYQYKLELIDNEIICPLCNNNFTIPKEKETNGDRIICSKCGNLINKNLGFPLRLKCPSCKSEMLVEPDELIKDKKLSCKNCKNNSIIKKIGKFDIKLMPDSIKAGCPECKKQQALSVLEAKNGNKIECKDCGRNLIVRGDKNKVELIEADYKSECPECGTKQPVSTDKAIVGQIKFCIKCGRKLKIETIDKNTVTYIPCNFETPCPECKRQQEILTKEVKDGNEIKCKDCGRNSIVIEDKDNINKITLEASSFKPKCPKCGHSQTILSEYIKDNDYINCQNKDCQRKLRIERIDKNEIKLIEADYKSKCPECETDQPISLDKAITGQIKFCIKCGRKLKIETVDKNTVTYIPCDFETPCPECKRQQTITIKEAKDGNEIVCEDCGRRLIIREDRNDINRISFETSPFKGKCPKCGFENIIKNKVGNINCKNKECQRKLKIIQVNKNKIELRELDTDHPAPSNPSKPGYKKESPTSWQNLIYGVVVIIIIIMGASIFKSCNEQETQPSETHVITSQTSTKSPLPVPTVTKKTTPVPTIDSTPQKNIAKSRKELLESIIKGNGEKVKKSLVDFPELANERFNPEVIKSAIGTENPGFDIKRENGWMNPLHLASILGNYKVYKVIIDSLKRNFSGAINDTYDKVAEGNVGRRTAVYNSAMRGNLEILRDLIENQGAEYKNIKDSYRDNLLQASIGSLKSAIMAYQDEKNKNNRVFIAQDGKCQYFETVLFDNLV